MFNSTVNGCKKRSLLAGAVVLGLVLCAAVMLNSAARRARRVVGRLDACRTRLAQAADYHDVNPVNNRLENRYPIFLGKQKQCLKEYDAAEAGTVNRAGAPALALLLARHRALAVIQQHCLESILIGRGLPRE